MRIGISENLVEEALSELVQGELRALYKFEGNEDNDGEDAEPAQQHQPGKYAVGIGRASESEKIFAHFGRFDRGRLGQGLTVFGVGFGLKLRLGDVDIRHVDVHQSQATGGM